MNFIFYNNHNIMDRIIYKSEDIDLSGADILRIVDDKARIMKYEELEIVNNIEDILQPYGAVVLLYETKQNFGHWVGLFKRSEDTLEFFDPYALDVDEELNINNGFHIREHGGRILPHLSHLLYESKYRVDYNKTRVQKMLKHVNTCGRHVAMRLRFRDVALPKYIRLLTKNEHYDPDFWVSAMTVMI